MSSRIITIDGPAGSGKSTVGQELALKKGWDFLDSGALYRCCAYIASENNIAISDLKSMIGHLQEFDFRSIPLKVGSEAKIVLNGEDVSSKIRVPSCANLASKLAAVPEIRKFLLEVQRNYFFSEGLVADGRDMGSIVFPDAILKIYLTASLQARAKRKVKQLNEQGINAKYQKIYYDIQNRDYRDSSRSSAPLSIPDSAFVLDTSHLSFDEVKARLIEEVEKVLNNKYGGHNMDIHINH